MKINWKTIMSTALAGLLLTACGTAGTQKELANGSTEPAVEQPSEDAAQVIDEGAVAVELVPKENADLVYEFKLNNTTDKDIKLSFSNLQEFDFILYAEDGSKAYQYSEEMMFGEAFVEKIIPAKETLVMEIDLYQHIPDLESGMYKLEVWSKALESDSLRTEIEIANSNDTILGVTTEVVLFVGMVDNHSVEIKDEKENERVFQITDDVKTYVQTIGTDERVTINYYEGENGTFIISSIIME